MFPKVGGNASLWALEGTRSGKRKIVSSGPVEEKGKGGGVVLRENEAADRSSNTFYLSMFQPDTKKLCVPT